MGDFAYESTSATASNATIRSERAAAVLPARAEEVCWQPVLSPSGGRKAEKQGEK